MRVFLRGRRSIWWGWRMTRVAPRIVNNISYATRMKFKCHFWWQAQYLVKFKCHYDSRSAKCCIFQYKMLVASPKVTSVARRVADWRICGRIMLGSFSDHSRIGLGSVAHCKWRFICFGEISVKFWSDILRGRRSIRWCWRMTSVAPRIVNNVSNVTRIHQESLFAWQAQYIWWCWQVTHVAPRIVNNVSKVRRIHHESLFAWQAQYLVRLADDTCCSAHCKKHFICDENEVQVSLLVAGAVFGEVQVSLFVAGAAFRGIWNDSRSAKCCIFQYKMLVASAKSNLGCEAGCGLTVLWSGHSRIGLGSVAHCKWRFICFGEISVKFWSDILRGSRGIWWCWRVTSVAPRIVNTL